MYQISRLVRVPLLASLVLIAATASHAADVLFPQSWIGGLALLNGKKQQNWVPLPNTGSLGNYIAKVSSPTVSADATTNVSFSNGTNNSAVIRFNTHAYGEGQYPNAGSQAWSTPNTNAGYGWIPVALRPVSAYGDRNGQRVLVTLDGIYSGTGNSKNYGGYNEVYIQYAYAADGYQIHTILAGKDGQFTGQQVRQRGQFYSTLGSGFAVRMISTSWAPRYGSNANLELDISVR